jgi:small subunit ribosomal protein S10e
MVLISKENRRKILEHLFKEGVITVKKDARMAKHQDVDVPNLHCMMLLKSLSSRDLVDHKFNWQWNYYTLTNDGIEHLRQVLYLQPHVFPQTLTKQRAAKPMAAPAGGYENENEEEGQWGGKKGKKGFKGKGKGKGFKGGEEGEEGGFGGGYKGYKGYGKGKGKGSAGPEGEEPSKAEGADNWRA